MEIARALAAACKRLALAQTYDIATIGFFHAAGGAVHMRPAALLRAEPPLGKGDCLSEKMRWGITREGGGLPSGLQCIIRFYVSHRFHGIFPSRLLLFYLKVEAIPVSWHIGLHSHTECLEGVSYGVNDLAPKKESATVASDVGSGDTMGRLG